MKLLFHIFFAGFFLTLTSCHTIKLVEKIPDAKKLETYKDKFLGKLLKELLSQIKPKIKFVYGNPENTSGHSTGGTYFVFYFVDKEEGKKRISAKDTPTRIFLQFQLEAKNNRRPLPKDGLKEWKNKETKEYGDMLILNIRVSGNN